MEGIREEVGKGLGIPDAVPTRGDCRMRRRTGRAIRIRVLLPEGSRVFGSAYFRTWWWRRLGRCADRGSPRSASHLPRDRPICRSYLQFAGPEATGDAAYSSCHRLNLSTFSTLAIQRFSDSAVDDMEVLGKFRMQLRMSWITQPLLECSLATPALGDSCHRSIFLRRK
jgi:hypothetical protein